ncbi:uncharacterized protein H6S33_012777 [Morchella sextelata]|uniref:uncharacterized protein n=1 Tax=Morchella sextelata TaxID=1174677 RepID=UPI001D0479F3|nr:uncharacterized protein H6S33_012777 [Morchella sextelata]KAH0609291.1 hypothetical protein H6S33_012777 [Morchella sextelata]
MAFQPNTNFINTFITDYNIVITNNNSASNNDKKTITLDHIKWFKNIPIVELAPPTVITCAVIGCERKFIHNDIHICRKNYINHLRLNKNKAIKRRELEARELALMNKDENTNPNNIAVEQNTTTATKKLDYYQKQKLLAAEKKKEREALALILEDAHFDAHAAEMATHNITSESAKEISANHRKNNVEKTRVSWHKSMLRRKAKKNADLLALGNEAIEQWVNQEYALKFGGTV